MLNCTEYLAKLRVEVGKAGMKSRGGGVAGNIGDSKKLRPGRKGG